MSYSVQYWVYGQLTYNVKDIPIVGCLIRRKTKVVKQIYALLNSQV